MDDYIDTLIRKNSQYFDYEQLEHIRSMLKATFTTAIQTTQKRIVYEKKTN